MKRRLGTTGLRTHIESPNAKHRKLLVPAPSVNEVEHILKGFVPYSNCFLEKTAPQQRPNRRALTEAMVNQLPQAASNEPTPDMSIMSTYSAFTVRLFFNNQPIAIGMRELPIFFYMWLLLTTIFSRELFDSFLDSGACFIHARRKILLAFNPPARLYKVTKQIIRMSSGG